MPLRPHQSRVIPIALQTPSFMTLPAMSTDRPNHFGTCEARAKDSASVEESYGEHPSARLLELR